MAKISWSYCVYDKNSWLGGESLKATYLKSTLTLKIYRCKDDYEMDENPVFIVSEIHSLEHAHEIASKEVENYYNIKIYTTDEKAWSRGRYKEKEKEILNIASWVFDVFGIPLIIAVFFAVIVGPHGFDSFLERVIGIFIATWISYFLGFNYLKSRLNK
jgi:hypothetical protein